MQISPAGLFFSRNVSLAFSTKPPLFLAHPNAKDGPRPVGDLKSVQCCHRSLPWGFNCHVFPFLFFLPCVQHWPTNCITSHLWSIYTLHLYSALKLSVRPRYIKGQVKSIPGFRCEVDLCPLLRYYAALSGNPLPTFRDKVLVPSSRVKKCKKKLTVCRLSFRLWFLDPWKWDRYVMSKRQ
jgi:hypothetical protein